MAFQFPTPPPLEQVGGLASGTAEGQHLAAPILQQIAQRTQEQRAAQQFPLQQQETQQHLQQMAQTIKNAGLEAPLQRELLRAQIAESQARAKNQHAVLPQSKMGQLVNDYNNALARGDNTGADNLEKAIKNELGNVNLSPAEKAYQQKSATDFVTAATKASNDADTASDAEQNIDSFLNAYSNIPVWAKGAMYVDSSNYPHLQKLQASFMNPDQRRYLNIAEKTSNRLVQNILGGNHYGRVTNKILEMTQHSTLSPGMYQGGVEQLAPLLRMQAQITQQKPLFYSALKDAGVTDAVKANSLWQKYLSQSNLIDKNDTVHPENLGNWRNYIPGAPKITASAGKQYTSKSGKKYTEQDIRDTMSKYGLTRGEVINRAGLK